MRSIVLFAIILVLGGGHAMAAQSLQAAGAQNAKLRALVESVKAAAGVACEDMDSVVTHGIYGPQGLKTTTHQVPCYDPDVFNPSQLGQLFVTYYGEGESATSAVGAVVNVNFEVWK